MQISFAQGQPAQRRKFAFPVRAGRGLKRAVGLLQQADDARPIALAGMDFGFIAGRFQPPGRERKIPRHRGKTLRRAPQIPRAGSRLGDPENIFRPQGAGVGGGFLQQADGTVEIGLLQARPRQVENGVGQVGRVGVPGQKFAEVGFRQRIMGILEQLGGEPEVLQLLRILRRRAQRREAAPSAAGHHSRQQKARHYFGQAPAHSPKQLAHLHRFILPQTGTSGDAKNEITLTLGFGRCCFCRGHGGGGCVEGFGKHSRQCRHQSVGGVPIAISARNQDVASVARASIVECGMDGGSFSLGEKVRMRAFQGSSKGSNIVLSHSAVGLPTFSAAERQTRNTPKAARTA